MVAHRPSLYTQSRVIAGRVNRRIRFAPRPINIQPRQLFPSPPPAEEEEEENEENKENEDPEDSAQ
jgi:hypothetical protein